MLVYYVCKYLGLHYYGVYNMKFPKSPSDERGHCFGIVSYSLSYNW